MKATRTAKMVDITTTENIYSKQARDLLKRAKKRNDRIKQAKIIRVAERLENKKRKKRKRNYSEMAMWYPNPLTCTELVSVYGEAVENMRSCMESIGK